MQPVAFYVVAVVLSACDMAYSVGLQTVVPDVAPHTEQRGLVNSHLMAFDVPGEQFLGPALGALVSPSLN